MDRVILTISSELFDDDPRQEASVRTNITARGLIEEIRREFSLPEGSYALRLQNGELLDLNKTLAQAGVQTGSELVFERQRRALSQMMVARGGELFQAIAGPPALLREAESGFVFPLEWQPAFVGRSSANAPGSGEQLAADLADLPEGRSVSRRHARLTAHRGRFFLEGLAEHNPTFLNEDELVLGEKREVRSGDRIRVGKVTLIFELSGA